MMTDKETVRRALFQVYGNVTAGERERLSMANAKCWQQQANGNAGSQLNAQRAFDEELEAIVTKMPAWRATTIATYIRGDNNE